MRKLWKLFDLFFENAKIRTSQAMAYRLNYLLDLFFSLAQGLIPPLLQYLIFSQTRGIPGWNLEQMILFQGLLLFFMGLHWTAFGDVYFNMRRLVWRGEFDRVLLKPYPAIGFILAGGFNPRAAGGLLAGPVVIAYAILQMRLEISIVSVGLVLVLLLFSLLLSMSFLTLYCSAVIVLVQLGRLYDIFWTLERFGQYPLEIFPRAVRVLFMTVVPMAVWVYFPAQTLLGRGDVNVVIALACSVAFFCLSLLVWRVCLKRYASAGG